MNYKNERENGVEVTPCCDGAREDAADNMTETVSRIRKVSEGTFAVCARLGGHLFGSKAAVNGRPCKEVECMEDDIREIERTTVDTYELLCKICAMLGC